MGYGIESSGSASSGPASRKRLGRAKTAAQSTKRVRREGSRQTSEAAKLLKKRRDYFSPAVPVVSASLAGCSPPASRLR